MAQPVATPENLSEFAQQLGQSLAEELGGGGGSQTPSGTSNLIHIGLLLTDEADKSTVRMYLVVNKDVDMSLFTLRFARYKRCMMRRKGVKYIPALNRNLRKLGWHPSWRLPVANKVPLVQPIIKSTPYKVENGNAMYEITVSGYDSFFDFCTDDGASTGYKHLDDLTYPFAALVSNGKCGICLMKEGVQVSNYSPFSGEYKKDDDIFHLSRWMNE
ncbi:MAG: hypothetical protein IJQ18_08640 [Paludibacteraceae bacterium]|nr:hypothetical protein [Paludibacteraceae bacterium]